MNTDPRRLGGDIAGPGGPHDEGGVVFDVTNAVLLDGLHVALMDPVRGGKREDNPTLVAVLEGRINKTPERAKVMVIFDEDGAAAILSEVMALASRIGPSFKARLSERVSKLLEEGLM